MRGGPCVGRFSPDRCRRRFVRRFGGARAVEREDYSCRNGRWRHASRPAEPIQTVAGILPRRGDAHTIERLRHQSGSVDPCCELERQIPGGRQRRLQRHYQLPGHGERADARLRDELHRHRTRGRRRGLGGRASGEGRRLRLARRSRNGDRVEEDHRESHRKRAHFLVLERLFRGRPAGDEGGTALRRGFQRHHRRCAGSRLDGARGAGGADRENAGAQRGRTPLIDRRQTSPSRRRQRLRRGRWLEGWADFRSCEMQVRSGRPAM